MICKKVHNFILWERQKFLCFQHTNYSEWKVFIWKLHGSKNTCGVKMLFKNNLRIQENAKIFFLSRKLCVCNLSRIAPKVACIFTYKLYKIITIIINVLFCLSGTLPFPKSRLLFSPLSWQIARNKRCFYSLRDQIKTP